MTGPAVPVVRELSADRQLQNDRLARSQDLWQQKMTEPGKDLGDLTDVEFEAGLRHLKTVQQRLMRVIAEGLTKDVHYGREQTADGKAVFKKDRLKKAGAEELRRLLRIVLKDVAPEQRIETAEYVSVVVTVGAFDTFGRLLATAQGACNTKEKRFKGFGGGWTYNDAREELHNCIAMARKRAGGLVTSEVTGATGFFADPDFFDPDDAEEETEDKPITPWTEEEKRICGEAAAAKGIGRESFKTLILATLGRPKVGTGEDCTKLMAAIGAWTKPGTTAAPGAPAAAEPVAAAPAPAVPTAAETAKHGTFDELPPVLAAQAAEDLEFDRRLAATEAARELATAVPTAPEPAAAPAAAELEHLAAAPSFTAEAPPADDDMSESARKFRGDWRSQLGGTPPTPPPEEPLQRRGRDK